MTIVLISLLDFESFSVRQLHAFLEKQGVDVKSVFLKSSRYDFPSSHEIKLLIDYLKLTKPSLVGISVRSRYYKLAVKVTKAIKKSMNVPIVWGGIHPTIAPDMCIKDADMLCLGEGEHTFKELAENINRDYSKIKNLWIKKDGKIIKNEIRPLFEDLDKLPFTDFSDKNKVYIEEGKLAKSLDNIKSSRIEFKFCYPIMTSRGCLFNCTYCANSFLRKLYHGKGKYTRRRSVKSVIDELKLAKSKMKLLNSVVFGDDVFTFDYKWLKEFALEYKKYINLPFFTMFNPSMVDARSVKLLKDIGLVNVQMGIQSGSERIRKQYYHRFNSNEQIRDAMRIFKKNKLKVGCDLILGNVFETEKDRKDTLDLLLSLPKPYALHCFCMNYFRNYEFTNMALNKNLISEEEIVDNKLYEKQSFGKQFDTNRDKSLLFWESVYKLATFKYMPCLLTKKLSNVQYLRRHPEPVLLLTKTLIRLRYMNKMFSYVFNHLSSPKTIYSKVKQKITRKQILS